MLKDNRMPTNQCTFFLYVPIPPANLSQGTVVTKRRPNSDGIINLSTIPQPPPRYTPKWLQDAPTPVAGRSGFVRHNRRIRGQILCTCWFYTYGKDTLDMPPSPAELWAEYCDLFLQQSPQGLRIWFLTEFPGVWKRVRLGYPHPQLQVHCLSIIARGPSGRSEPSWITRKTLVSYSSKRAKELVRKPNQSG